MNKLYLLLVSVFTYTFCFGQYNEVEPNNTFATAQPLVNSTWRNSTITAGDSIDYIRVVLPANGTIYLFLSGQNTLSPGIHNLKIELFNSLQQGGLVDTKDLSYYAGWTFNERFEWCGKAADTFYLAVTTNGSFNYNIQWGFTQSQSDLDDNNDFATAESFTKGVEKLGNLNYEYQGNGNADSVDYFKTTLPAANYDTVSLILWAKNTSCLYNKGIQYFCFKNNDNAPFATGYIGNESVNPSNNYNAYATVPLNELQAGDELYVKFISNAAFEYKFSYENAGVDDEEPNEDLYEAKTLTENVEKQGKIGYPKSNDEDWDMDEIDNYRLIFPTEGVYKIYVQGVNKSCNGEANYLEYYLVDKFDGLYSMLGELDFARTYVCGQTVTRTFTVAALSDTFYLQLFSRDPIDYTIRYEFIEPSASDVEPNNTQATATPIVAAEVKKGHVAFYSVDEEEDDFDYYKTKLPASGKVTVFVKSKYRADTYSGSTMMFGFVGKNLTSQIPKNYSSLKTDSVYLDTFNICGVGAGDVYFYFRSSFGGAWEYEFRYELTDSSSGDAEPNNSQETAINFSSGQIVSGTINYTNTINTTGDPWDFYKLFVGTTDSVKIRIQATNKSCTNNKWIEYVGRVRKYIGGTQSIAAGQTVYDTIKLKITAPDTLFFHFVASAAFDYQFTVEPILPTSVFSLVGDTTVCMGQQIYKATNVTGIGLTYNWSLPLGGGTISSIDSIATVTWNENATRRVELYLSNSRGNSVTKKLNVVIDGAAPTQVPVAYNFSRTLSTNSLPLASTVQWYRNDTIIVGATDSIYYAQLAGSYLVKYINDCGPGPSSNSIVFGADAVPQTITLNQVNDFAFSPSAKAFLSSTASSSLPVLYQVVSGNANILNDTLYVTSAGTVIIKLMQPGNDIYNPAPPKFDTIIVSKGAQVIVFDSIPTKIFSAGRLDLTAIASSGLDVDYVVVSGNASMITTQGFQTNSLRFTGAGSITLRAIQNGNNSYNAATPVERTFCIGVRSLTSIAGDPNPCIATYKYTTQKIPGATYEWTLSGGGILTTNNDTAYIQWQTPGSYTLKVKANTTCDTVYSNEVEFSITTSDDSPAAVTGMLPADGAIDQQLPLKLSWIPGSNTVNYDLYIWESSATQPATPYAANINTITYTIPKNSFAYNTTYRWRVVAKNPCTQTAGPIQTFRLIPLADLVVSDVLAPTSANSGQTVTISWKVTNIGPGRTLTTQSWKDGVFFSFDTTPNFRGAIGWDPTVWSSLTTERRPLLLGTKSNVSALDVGESYTNSISFKLPVNYSQPLYVYVMTNYPEGNNAPLQVTLLNDTARAPHTIDVTLSPTPDLRIDSVFTPTTTFSGSTINLTYKVKNYGVVTPVGSVWYDSVFISQNPLFDRAQAIALNFPLKYGQYYPNANDAVISNNMQLLPDSFYTRNTQVVVPNFIFGTWFIYVKANAKSTLYEGSLNNNNINRSQLEVYLTPTPKLQVNQLNVPVTSASTTQPIGVNWNVNNAGFNDNAERSKGHRFHDIGSCSYPIPCDKKSSSNRMATSTISSPKKAGISTSLAAASRVAGGCFVQGTWAQDSITFGSSYWLDRVYISKDSTGLNINNAILVNESVHGTENSGLFVEFTLDQYLKSGSVNQYCFMPTNNLSGYDLNVKNVINPGSNFAKSAGFKIPSNLPEGNYFVYVHTNATKTVYEYPGSPQITRSALPISVQRPDITVSAISVPANVSGGQSFTINYSLLNNGAGAVFNHVRRDKIYVSNFSSFDASAQLIETKTFTNDLPVGIPVPHTTTYKFPEATSGARYFYVLTNFDSAFLETNANNNLSASVGTMVSAALPTDLTVSSIQLADTIFTIHPEYIKYTVPNNGTGTTNGTWTDSLFVSCSPTFNKATSFFVAKRVHNEVLLTGESYTDSFYFSIPQMSYEINTCFPKTPTTTAYFFIKTNADTSVYEGSDINNNITGTGSRVLVNPLVDRIVTSIIGADTVTVARPVTIRWTVKNIGYDPGRLYDGSHSGYYDAVYFSPDSVFNGNAVLANSFLKYSAINRNDTARDTKSVITPNIVTGDYYVFVKTNSTERIRGEIALNNNTNLIRSEDGAAKKIHVIQPLLPDLVDSILTAPQSVAIGQPITVIHRVTNKGAGMTYPSSWYHTLLLSSDFLAAPNDGDRLLNQKTRIGALLPGQSYDDTITVTIPQSTLPGNYILISRTNSTGSVFESNSNNNLAFSLLNVYVPPPVDLIVENIMKPDTVMLGYTIDSVKWVIKNASAEEAKGISKDGIYLSKNEVLDSTAVLIGLQDKILSMDALANDTLTMAPLVSNVVEGNYNLIIKTDLLNNIVEEDKDNNTGTAATPIYVKVKELPLNVVEANTLHKTGRFYKLLIPDTLLGSTIKITLKSNDSLFVRNEMFVGGGYIPSGAKFDYKFEIPNYGNQQIVMTSVLDSVYYIAFNAVSPNPPVQNVTIKAEVLPFAILNVHTSSGGNIGNVTVKISGSLFTDSMTATLSKPGTTIHASAVYFTNSTTAYATFPLQGKPLGVYDISLTKVDSETTTLSNGFSVVPANNGGLITGGGINKGAGNGNEPGCDPGAESGLNSQLVVEMVVPARALIRRPIVIQINYHNPTNVDISAQSRVLYTEEGMKLSFTREGVATGTTSMYLELTEPGGPPGIIRAGGSGTITLYSVMPAAVPVDPVLLFKMK